jgi:hypothetical protein
MILTTVAFTILTLGLPNDKVIHAGASFGLTAGSYLVCRTVFDGGETTCRVAAALGTLAVGAAKEVADGSRNTNKEHMLDMGANTVGVGLGLLFTLPF